MTIPTELQEALIRLSVRIRERGRDPKGYDAFETIRRYVVETEAAKQAINEAMSDEMKEKIRAFNDLAPHVVFIPSPNVKES